MRTFMVLVRKELGELLTLQMLAPFIAIIFVFMALGNVISAAGDTDEPTRVVVVDNDGTAESAVIGASLEAVGLTVVPVQDEDLDAVVTREADSAGLYVVVPEGFGASLERGEPAMVQVRTVMTGFSFLGMRGGAEVQNGLAAANQSIATAIAARHAPDVPVALLQQPLTVENQVTIGERTAATSAEAVAGFVSQQTTLIPIVLFIVIVFAAQMIATTIATEKENKTLETLLSYPISRTSLVTAKMVAAGLVSLLSAGAYMIGMRQYMAGMMSGVGEQSATDAMSGVMAELGLTLTTADYAMLGLSLFAGILLALSIAIILGAFAESVKAVGALITPLMMTLMVPYLLTMFIDLNSASPLLKWAVLAIPFTHPFTAAQNLFLGNEGVVWAGIAYQLVWFAGFALIAAKVFSSDRILTMKLDLRRKR
ncbi:MAG: ABC transporter permease [Aeromicrobium sp.]|nr:ABC transporter permease [Aeromicrobium sp.]